MYLVDTNIVSELMRPSPANGVVQWKDRLEESALALVISAITVDEIIFGLQWRPHAAKMAWFNRFMQYGNGRGRRTVARLRRELVRVPARIARRAGEMRAQLALAGQVREQADMLIAATAQIHALTLVTRNVRDFDGCGIAVLNPFTP